MEICWASFLKVLIPFMGALPSWLNHLPRTLTPTTIILEIRFSMDEFWGRVNIQTIEVTVMWMASDQQGYCVCVVWGLGRMKTILRSLFNAPKGKHSIILFITYCIHYFLGSTTEVSIRTRKTWSQQHWCSLLIPALCELREEEAYTNLLRCLLSWLIHYFSWLPCFWAFWLFVLLGLCIMPLALSIKV